MPDVSGYLTSSPLNTRKVALVPYDAVSPCDTRYQGSGPCEVNVGEQYTITGVPAGQYKVVITNLVNPPNKKCDWGCPASVKVAAGTNLTQDVSDPWANPQVCS